VCVRAFISGGYCPVPGLRRPHARLIGGQNNGKVARFNRTLHGPTCGPAPATDNEPQPWQTPCTPTNPTAATPHSAATHRSAASTTLRINTTATSNGFVSASKCPARCRRSPESPIAAERHRLKKRAWGHKTEHRLRVRAQIRTTFGVPLALARPAVHRGCRRPGVRHPAQARLATHRVPRLGLDLGPRVAREMIRPRRVIFPNSPAFGVAKLVTASVTSSGSGVRPVRAAHRRSSSPLR
jgi:hypothetical protein